MAGLQAVPPGVCNRAVPAVLLEEEPPDGVSRQAAFCAIRLPFLPCLLPSPFVRGGQGRATPLCGGRPFSPQAQPRPNPVRVCVPRVALCRCQGSFAYCVRPPYVVA